MPSSLRCPGEIACETFPICNRKEADEATGAQLHVLISVDDSRIGNGRGCSLPRRPLLVLSGQSNSSKTSEAEILLSRYFFRQDVFPVKTSVAMLPLRDLRGSRGGAALLVKSSRNEMYEDTAAYGFSGTFRTRKPMEEVMSVLCCLV